MDNTGARFDFTVAADTAESLVWAFSRMNGEAFDLSDASFEAVVRDAAGAEALPGMTVQHGSSQGELLVNVGGLAAAVYGYEVWASSAEGKRVRMLYGSLTAVSSSAALLLTQDAAAHPCRTLSVFVPDEAGAPLLLAWKGGSVVGALANLAAGHAQDAARSAAAAAKSAAESADLLAMGKQQMQEALKGISDEVKAVNAVLAVWDGKIQTAIVLNPETGTLWIGGLDTGCRYQGEPGKSPWISPQETWVVWDDALDGWRDTGKPVRGDDGFSPYVNALGNWVTRNPITGQPEDSGYAAVGRDGIDGSAVRRVVVDAEGELPTAPELCHGGVYCYVPLQDAPAVAMLTVHESGRRADDRLVVDGVEVALPAPDVDPAEAAAALAGALEEAGFSAMADGAVVSLVGDCRHAFVFDELNEDGYSVVVHVGMCREHAYSVFAWLEQPDGSAGWACVGEASDFATAEVAGIVKLATDVRCEAGAPVAQNMQGQMVVPHADYATAGSVLPSEPETMGSGALVGFDADGRMLVTLARFGHYGAVKPGWAGLADCDCVGLMADGSLGATWATLTHGGVLKLGSALNELNPIPYIVGIGATPDHAIANNLLYGGALQHQRPAGWMGFGMAWLDSGSRYLDGSSYYLGLATSDSFVQSKERGLELVDATQNHVLGGVYVADTVSATAAMVPSSLAVFDFVRGYAYSKKECDDTFETQQHAAATWEVRTHAASTYETKADADGKSQTLKTLVRHTRDELQEQIDGKVSATAEWVGDVVLTQSQYDNLSEVNPRIKYYIVEA